jgi:hypothetical protein
MRLPHQGKLALVSRAAQAPPTTLIAKQEFYNPDYKSPLST